MDPHFFTCVPLNNETRFLSEKLIFTRVTTYFYLFFKRGNKLRNKTLKNDSLFLKKCVFEKPESNFEGQVTYREGTMKLTSL